MADICSKEELFRKCAGKYLLVKFEIGGADCSERYVNGWKDRSLYMYFDISEDGRFVLRACGGGKEKEYEYFLDPVEMKYYLKPDHTGTGTPITIKNGVLTEQSEDHLMVYELTDELD